MNIKMNYFGLIVFLIFVIILSIIFAPLLTLWCVYTIWNIEETSYDFWHWLAALCLSGTLAGMLGGINRNGNR
ncbi:MAG: hypothetical protein WCY37_03535 [Candidatus Dojkabacteria bacterium]